MSSLENEPYPNKLLIISSEAIIKPKLAGIENNNESSNELFCILETLLIFFDLNAFEKQVKKQYQQLYQQLLN